MTMIYFKFPDEAAAIAALAQFRGKDEAGKDSWITSSHEHYLGAAVALYAPTGKMLEGEYGPFEEKTLVAGYHVNFVGAVPKEAEAFVVVPVNPQVVMS